MLLFMELLTSLTMLLAGPLGTVQENLVKAVNHVTNSHKITIQVTFHNKRFCSSVDQRYDCE